MSVSFTTIRTLPTTKEGERVNLTYSPSDHAVSAIVIDRFGRETPVPPEQMPREFRQIRSEWAFHTLLDQVYVRTPKTNDGAAFLYVEPKLKGGGGGSCSVVDAEGPNLSDQIRSIVDPGLKELSEKDIRENAIALIGRSGSGKSSLGNLLLGCVLRPVQVGLEFKHESINPIFPVSHSNVLSCTGCPNVHTPKGKTTTYIDLPGWDDTRGVPQDIANGIFRKEVLKDVKNLRMILVVDYNDIAKKGNHLIETFDNLLEFLGFSDTVSGTKDTERLRKLADSMLLIISQVPAMEDSAVSKAIREFLRKYVSESKLSINGQSILRKILRDSTPQTPKWGVFSAPSSNGLNSKITNEKAGILKQLDEMHSISCKGNLDLQTTASSKHQGTIQTALKSMIASLNRSFPTKIVEAIGKSLTDFYTGVAGETALKVFQARYQALIKAKEPRSLSELLRHLSFREGIFGNEFLEEAREKDESMKYLADLLPRGQASLIPCRRDWLEKFGIREQLQVWNELLVRMTAEAVFNEDEIKKKKIILQGYFPKTSQITNKLEGCADIVEIEIHALHTVIIDEDLTGPKLAGVNVTIIAPKWEIRHKRTINLTGASSTHTYETPAAEGVRPSESGLPGDPGRPGSNGGHFFGIGLACSEVDRLTIISNGGKGGVGQQGGQGRDGANGADGFAKMNFCETENGARDEPTAKSMGWDYVQWPPHHHHDNKYDMELIMYGKPGGVGGNGGMGGAGGLGGRAGSIEFLSVLDQNANVHSEALAGALGAPGAAGGVGIGGRKGRDWGGVWSLGHGRPRFHVNQPYHRGEPGTGPKSADGTASAEKNAGGRKDPDPLIPFDALAHLHHYRTFAITESNPIVMEAMEIFRQIYDSHSAVQKMANVDRFIDECQKMEKFYTALADKKKALPLYRWMLERIQIFERCNSSQCNPSQIALLQCLHTCTLSKILQIQASMESRLIIDIKSFLAQTEANITALERLDHNVLIAAYENGYVDQINSKIQEADLFIQKLSEDIRAADKEIEEQIKRLLAEIKTLGDSLNDKQGEISAKRQKLKEMIEKRKIFGVLTIAVQAIGCCFPPAGPIVAGVASAGLAALNNPDLAPVLAGQVLNAYIEGMGTPGTELTQAGNTALVRVRTLTVLNAAVQAINPASGSEEEQLKAMDKAIQDIEEQRRQLHTFKGQVNSSFAPSLHAIVDQAEELQRALQGKTKVALDFSRLATKRAFENLKIQMKETTKAFATGEGFLNIIQQMEDAIDTSAKIYEHIEEYREKRQLAKFIARLAAPTVTDPRIENYKQLVQRNVVLEQYTRAVAAVKQWAFPFASLFLGDFANLQSFIEAATVDQFMILIRQQIGLLRNKVETRNSEINNRRDTYLWTGNFNKSQPHGPFYTWKYEEHGREIRDLLRGEQVVLLADVARKSPQYSAIKFNQIELEICAADSLLQQELSEALEGARVELQHSGISYYKYDDKIYQMANDKGFSIKYRYTSEENGPSNVNEVYRKMKTGNFMLSPFTRWVVKLENKGLLEQFSEELPKIEIHLRGWGQYIDTVEASEQNLKIDGYEDSVFLGSADRVPALAPPKTAAVAISQGPAGLGRNAANSSHDPSYLYQATDVHAIGQSPQLCADLDGFYHIPSMQANRLVQIVDEIITTVTSGRSALCVYNLGDVHWVTFAITRRSNGQLVLLYKDSFGLTTDTGLLTLFSSRVQQFKSHPRAEQQGDGTSCGIFALENMRIIANQLRSNAEQFITNFEGYPFCTLERARELRRGDFARFYTEGAAEGVRIEAEQADRARALRTAHQGEVDEIIRRLRIVATGMTVQTESTASNATNTIVVQIEATGDNFTDYQYRIKGTDDIPLDQLQNFLQSRFEWRLGVNYRIEGRIIRVSTKITLT